MPQSPIKIRRILFPTDFSNCSKHALKYALAFAKEHSAKLFVLHVVPNLHIPHGRELLKKPLSEIYESMTKNAKAQIARVVPKRFKAKIEVQEIVVRGEPFLEIVRKAKERKADLIVISTHGHTGIAEAIFGSVTEKVVKKAPCPVLTVQHPEHDFVTP